MAKKEFSKDLTQRVQLEILDEIDAHWGKQPLRDAESRARWPGIEQCYSNLDSSRVEQIQVCRVRLSMRLSPVQTAGKKLIAGLEDRLEAVHYAALEQMIYQNMRNNSTDPEEQAFLGFLLNNSLRHPDQTVKEFDEGLLALAYLTGEKPGPVPEQLRQQMKDLFQLDLTPELLALSTYPSREREYQMLFGAYHEVGALNGKFDFWNFLAHGYDQNFDALLGQPQEKGMDFIQIDGVALSECMQGQLENLTNEEETKLKKLVLCAAVLSKNAKVVCHMPNGQGGMKDVAIRPGDGAQLEPASLDNFLRQFQPCFVKERESPALSANNMLVKEKHGPELRR